MKRISHRLSQMAFLTVMPLTFLCLIPQPAFSQIAQEPPATVLMSDILQAAADHDTEALQDAFQAVAQTINESDDPASLTRSYIEAFVAEANARSGGSLTVPDVLTMIKEHLNIFQIPLAEQQTIVNAIEVLENNDPMQANGEWHDAVAGKKHHHHHHHKIPWAPILIGAVAIVAMAINPPAAIVLLEGAVAAGVRF